MIRKPRVDINELRAYVDTPTDKELNYLSMAVGPPERITEETIRQLVEEIRRGELGALRAVLEAMRYFTEKRIFDMAVEAQPGAALIASAFTDFEGMLIDMFRLRLSNNSAARHESGPTTDGE